MTSVYYRHDPKSVNVTTFKNTLYDAYVNQTVLVSYGHIAPPLQFIGD